MTRRSRRRCSIGCRRLRANARRPGASGAEDDRPPLDVQFAGGHRIALEAEAVVKRESIINGAGSLALILPLLLVAISQRAAGRDRRVAIGIVLSDCARRAGLRRRHAFSRGGGRVRHVVWTRRGWRCAAVCHAPACAEGDRQRRGRHSRHFGVGGKHGARDVDDGGDVSGVAGCRFSESRATRLADWRQHVRLWHCHADPGAGIAPGAGARATAALVHAPAICGRRPVPRSHGARWSGAAHDHPWLRRDQAARSTRRSIDCARSPKGRASSKKSPTPSRSLPT